MQLSALVLRLASVTETALTNFARDLFYCILNKAHLCRSILLEELVINNITVMSGFLMSQTVRGASLRYVGSNHRDGFLIRQ
jgi:hypothetical protein